MTSKPNEIEKNSFRKGVRNFLSGAGAGVVSTVLCSPLDVVKIRMQVQGSIGIIKYTGTVHALRTIYKEEKLSGLFKGLGPALLTVPLFWSIYFYTYERLKDEFRVREYSPISSHIFSAVIGGAIGDVVTNPFWVTRTRIQTMALHRPESSVGLASSVSTFQMMRSIYRNEGVLAFYKGLSASLLGLSHVAVQFPLYEHLKMLARQYRDDGKESALDLIGASITAKYAASLATYPHEVLRSRIQDSQHKSLTLKKAFLDIVQREGFWALWVGIRVNLLKVIPSTVSTFLAYEYFSRYFAGVFASSTRFVEVHGMVDRYESSLFRTGSELFLQLLDDISQRHSFAAPAAHTQTTYFCGYFQYLIVDILSYPTAIELIESSLTHSRE